MLNSRATDRHRLIMCHCHFLYDWIYYPPVRNFSRLIKQRKRSFKRQKSSSQSLYGVNMNIEENFCPYTRKIPSTNSDEKKKKKFEIVCPMENSCADVRILNEFFSKTTEENSSRIRSFDLRILLVFMCGGETNDVETFFSHLASNFPFKITNERGETSFIVQTLLNRSNRQVKSKDKSLFFSTVFRSDRIDSRFFSFVIFVKIQRIRRFYSFLRSRSKSCAQHDDVRRLFNSKKNAFFSRFVF